MGQFSKTIYALLPAVLRLELLLSCFSYHFLDGGALFIIDETAALCVRFCNVGTTTLQSLRPHSQSIAHVLSTVEKGSKVFAASLEAQAKSCSICLGHDNNYSAVQK